MVYKFTVHCIVYSKFVVTYKFTSLYTDKSVSYYTHALLTVCFSTNQRAITLLHCLHVQENTIWHLLHNYRL